MYNKDLKIEIRPIPNRGDIKKFSENLEYFSQSNTIPCLVNPVTMKYETGLSDKDIEYLEENNFPYDLSDNWQRGVSHPFWENSMSKMELGPSPTFLYPGKSLIDFVKYKWMLKSAYIYSSEQEVESGTKTEATHYIYNESEDQETKASKLQARNERIRKISALSLKKKRDIVMIIEDEDMEGKDESYLTIKFEEITKDKEKALELDLLLGAKAEDLSVAAEIKNALYKNVLKKTGKGIFYFDTNLGYAEEEVKEFLSKPDNQEIYLNIKKQLQ